MSGDTPLALFSGGSLMVGTAARTDLLGMGDSWPMALQLRASLQNRVLTLPEQLQVFPTHGAGSLCASGANKRRTTTIGEERTHNRLALAQSDLEFASIILDQGPYPTYFDHMRGLNKVGAPLLGRNIAAPPRLSLDEFDGWRLRGAAVLDLRQPRAFSDSHIPGTYALGLEGRHSSWVGWLFSPTRPLVLLTDDEELVSESLEQLARIGYDQVVGTLTEGLAHWVEAGRPTSSYGRIAAQDLGRQLLAGERLPVVDVRERSEWSAGHIPGSLNVPVHEVGPRAVTLPQGSKLAVHCGGSFRATLAASILEQRGFRELIVVEDGYVGWAAWAADHLAALGLRSG
jgi:hydroxyacylglutathione hydrolase